MWFRNGGLFAAVVALLAASVVAFGTWFTLSHTTDWRATLETFSDDQVGLITLAAVLLAGWLLATVFDRAEEAVVLFQERSSDESGSADSE